MLYETWIRLKNRIMIESDSKKKYHKYKRIEAGTFSNKSKASTVLLDILNNETQNNKITRKVLCILNQCNEILNVLKTIKKDHKQIYFYLLEKSKKDFTDRLIHRKDLLFPDNVRFHLHCVIMAEFRNALNTAKSENKTIEKNDYDGFN